MQIPSQFNSYSSIDSHPNACVNVRGRLKIIDRRPHVLQSQDSPTVRLLIVVGIALVETRERLESLASPLPSRQIKVFTRLVLVEIFQVIERRTHATNFASMHRIGLARRGNVGFRILVFAR